MSPTPRRPDAPFTYDDLVRLPYDGKRHEIIGGVHYVTPSPLLRHQILVGRLYLALGNFLAEHRHLARVYLSPVDVVFSPIDVVVPDLIVVSSDQLDVLTEQNVRGAPALVVEVLSPSTRRRDRTRKRTLFSRSGVREYWMVDPARHEVTVCRGEGGPFAAGTVLEASAVLRTPLLPGFSIALDTLFAPEL